MSRLPSIRRRLTAQLVTLSLLWGIAVAGAVWLALVHEMDELLDDTLRASAEVLYGLLEAGSTMPTAPAQAPQEHFAWQLVGEGSQVLLRSARAPDKPLMPLPTYGFADAAQWRVYGLRFGDGRRVLYVAQTRAERREAELETALTAVIAALGVGLLSVWWLRTRLRRELQPLQALTASLQHYEPLVPSAPLQAATRRELVPIHEAIDALGRRLAQRVANERAFSAHAAHALRTPLAGIDAQLAVALRECPPELRARLERVRLAAARLTRVVGALLALFRSGVEPQWQDVDLGQLLARLPLEGLALQVAPHSVVQADPDLLTGALLNLLDNSLRHGATHVAMHLDAAPGGGTLLVLQDDGHGIEPSRREALQRALDTQAYEGVTGLGLMLADLVVRAHGGALHLAPSALGCRVEMRLGAAPDRPKETRA